MLQSSIKHMNNSRVEGSKQNGRFMNQFPQLRLNLKKYTQ